MPPYSRSDRSPSSPSHRGSARSEVDAALAELEERLSLAAFADALATSWDRGWQVLDVVRFVDRVGAEIRRRVVVDAVVVDRRRWHPRAAPLWAEQADRVGATSRWWDDSQPYWAQVADRLDLHPRAMLWGARILMNVLSHLPDMPSFEAPPTEPARVADVSGTDPTMLARVRALLAKAESTTFEAEAEALTAKAQELIARHAIDVALLGDAADVPGGRRIAIERPYANAKFQLLAGIAEANHCRACYHQRLEVVSVMGHRDDLRLVEVLYTSLLVQGTSAVLAASRRGEVQGSTRAWRNAFWHGFAGRIAQRLADASAAVRADHRACHGDDLLPVLAGRRDAVDKAFAEAFPRLTPMRSSVSSYEGLRAGRRFADRVRLDAAGDLDGGGRRAIGQ